jgi:hypothetical protein
MSCDFCDFEFTVGSARTGSQYILGKNPYKGRAFRSAIEAAFGSLPKTMSLDEAFAVVREAILLAAEDKVIAMDGEIDEPVPVSGPDICS